MLFDQEAIARLTPAVRVEIQEYYVRKYLAERTTSRPERRRARMSRLSLVPRSGPADVPATVEPRRPWPQVWHRNDSTRPTSFAARIATLPER